ncbi:HPr family phosphocarrier protein [Allorhizocola rhizosphaerae]|uniref:HPr family phosphocarrier protein n=1 Tax=Allorhizocola rhizosphaerae TaxID=1872709 RepID=UPI001FEC56D2|nr:HPr family phosphocarrier protein [Allorhizocola rhizosphaerae]
MVVVKESLHARPAAVFVQAVLDSGQAVGIARPGGAAADARSILSVLALDIRSGERVVLSGGSRDVLDRLAGVLA